MVAESRCGLACGECGYGKETGCVGCVDMEAPPWGEACPVKDCCEKTGLEHCGLCDGFPCALLNSFAYHEEQGDDGQRLENLREWRKQA